MPTIAQAITDNMNRDSQSLVFSEQPDPVSAPSPITFQAPVALPVRGVLPPNLIIGTDFYAGGQQFRVGTRSSAMPAASQTRQRATPTLANKVLVAPTIGVGAAKLNRYNTVTTTLTPTALLAGVVATQTFSVPAVQAADKVIGYQWNTAQLKGVTTLAVRVVSGGNIAVDFFNGTAGTLTPTGGSLTLFLVQ